MNHLTEAPMVEVSED